MPVYKYKVKDGSGRIQIGESNVESKERLLELFATNGLEAIEVIEKNYLTDISQIKIFRKKVSLQDLAQFCRQMAIMLNSGISLANCLDDLRGQDMNITLQETVADVYLHIQKGMSLSVAMAQYPDVFPKILLSMVEAGEVSGQLDGVFVKMAEHFEKESKQIRKIKGALTYPIIVLGIALLVVAIMIGYVIPTFAKALRGMDAELPAITQFMLGVSDFFVTKWYILLLAIVGFIALYKVIVSSDKGRRSVDTLKLKLPLIKDVSQTSMTARLTSTLSTLLSSGVLIIESLEIIQRVLTNSVISDKMSSAIESIKQGRSMYRALLDMQYFPSLAMSMVRTGEESGSLDESLSKAAEFYEEQLDIKINRLTTFIEPLIMIVLGGVVMLIMFSILYPMISVYQNMGI
jgi:type IV pilus assembly protein PilC